MIRKIFVRDNNWAEHSPGIEIVYLIEGEASIAKLANLFANPAYQEWSQESALEEAEGAIIEVRYKKSVTDPEANSILAAAKAVGENGIIRTKIGRRYKFPGLSREKAISSLKDLKRFNLFNPVVHEIADPNEELKTLKPDGFQDKTQLIPLKNLSDQDLLKLSLNNSWNTPLSQLKSAQGHEYSRVRPHTDAELEIIFGCWSDHCYHTTWKSLKLLDRLKEATRKINHPRVVSAYSDNAGGIDFDGEIVLAVKGETHNHPFPIFPKGAIETKHGGIIRDIIGFGKGAHPIGGTTLIGVTNTKDNPEECIPPDVLIEESIKATAAYLNPMGIPMMHALFKKHKKYAKPFALGHSIGVIPKKYALKEIPKPGDIVLLIGGKTGRDGIHGATASSGEGSASVAEKDFTSVQIGDPITERKIMEAIPVLRDAECLRSLTDLGAMGIGSAAAEIGAKTGIRIRLDAVLLKDQSLSAREVLISESQERMLLVVPPEKLKQARRILNKFGVLSANIGEFTNTRKFEASWNGIKVVDLEMRFIWMGCTIDKIPVREPRNPAAQGVPNTACGGLKPIGPLRPDAIFRFDKTVQGRTVIEPVENAIPTHISVLAPTRNRRGAITAVSFNPNWADLPAREYVQKCFLEAVSRAVLGGADPENIFICSNFYTSKLDAEKAWYLTEMVDELARLTELFGMPVITGKDSSSGTFLGQDGNNIDVPMTFVPFALGIVPDLSKITTHNLKAAENKLIVVSPGAHPDLIDFFKNLHKLYQSENNPIMSAGVVGENGLLTTLFEMACAGRLGAMLNLNNFCRRRLELSGTLTQKFIGSFVFEIVPDAQPEKIFYPLPWCLLGEVSDKQEIFMYYDKKKDWTRRKIDKLKRAYGER